MKHAKEEHQETEEKEKKKFSWKTKLLFFFVIFIAIVLAILLYSRYIATSGINIKEYKITNYNIPEQFHGLKIAHISDIHYGRTIHIKELKNLVEKINLTKPDIIVFTGDLIDKDFKITNQEIEQITEILKNLQASIGKYAIKGEHDLVLNSWDILMENSGFTNLNNTYDTIYKENNNYMLISGINSNNDESAKADEKLSTTKNFIASIPEENKPKYNILLLHEPDIVNTIDIDTWNLVLAGHSHNGQIKLPIVGAILIPEGAKQYYGEHYTINQAELYISGGIGVSNLNFRLFTHPSFNLYRLTNY